MTDEKKTTRKGSIKQTQRFYADALFMLAAPAVMAWYFYGAGVFRLMAAGVLGAVVCEAAGGLIKKTGKPSLADLNAVFTGAVIAMMLPANAPAVLAAAGGAFAVAVAKLPFGSTRNSPFIPAAAGFAFLCVCWPQAVFSYPALPEAGRALGAASPAGVSVAAMLKENISLRLNDLSRFDLLIGNIPGPMGTGSILILASAAVYFLFRRPLSLLNTLGFIGGCAAMALLFPRVLTGRAASLTMELCSGSLVFAAVFLVTDLSVSPKKAVHRFLFGLTAGVLCMLTRYFGAYEEGVCFALMLAGAVWPFVEDALETARGFFKNPAGKTPVKTPAPKGGTGHAR